MGKNKDIFEALGDILTPRDDFDKIYRDAYVEKIKTEAEKLIDEAYIFAGNETMAIKIATWCAIKIDSSFLNAENSGFWKEVYNYLKNK
jgi:hypothetical protein